ncbi:hypothetical protein JCM5353_006048 [Sporobolomyces roseus]
MADSLPTPADSPLPPSDHLAQGIRFLSLHKYSQASETLTYAVEHLIEKNGELSIENVDALVLCGKALLGNAIEQSAVLGGNVNNTSNALPDSIKPDGATSASGSGGGGSSSTNMNATAGPSNSAFHFGGDGEEEEDDDEEGEGEGEGAEGEGQGQEGEGDGGEKDDDFESAFIMLDLARRSVEVELERLEKEKDTLEQEDKDKVVKGRKEKLAEIHRLLGDVATESEQFDSAVEEYSSSLSILSQILPPSDRQLSEQHMLIALASEFLPQGTGLTRAVSHAEKAKSVLVLRVSELEAQSEADKSDKDKKEIENIRELLGDVDNKIEDLKTVPTEPEPSASDKALEDFLRQATGVNSSAPVNDLNSLVKKKKKPISTPAAGVVKKEEAPIEGTVVEEDGQGKRKAEEPVGKEEESEEKKVKVSSD